MLIAILAIVLGALWLWFLKRKEWTTFHYINTPTNAALLEKCPTLASYSNMPIWGINGHLQSFYASQIRKGPTLPLKRTTIRNEYGGTIAIDWLTSSVSSDVPVVCVIPGIAGHTDNDYMKNFMNYCKEAGLNVVAWNWPGCGHQLTHWYMKTLGDYRDLIVFFNHVRQMLPNSKLYAVSFSLGANLLLRYLGEVCDDTPVTAAVAFCAGFCGRSGFRILRRNKIYSRVLAKKWKDVIVQNQHIYKDFPQIDLQRVLSARSLEELDAHFTVKLFQEQYTDLEDYYSQHSSIHRLKYICRPTLLVNALDDPIIKGKLVDLAKVEVANNPHIIMAYTQHGGHLGWVQSDNGFTPNKPLWLDKVAVEFVKAAHSTL